MSKLEFTEALCPKGAVQITVTQNGETTELPVDPNMIVYSGRSAIASGLLNTSQAYISGVVFGRMSAAEVVTPEMKAVPNIVQTTAADYTMTIIDGSAAKPPRLQYVITIPETGMNNKTFNTAALMLNTGLPFAIKKFGDITKTSAMGLSITWTIYV